MLYEQHLQAILTALAPQAPLGVIVAASCVAVLRLPILSIASLVATCAFLAAVLSTGEGGLDAGMTMLVAAGAAGLVLLLSREPLWRRPPLRRRTTTVRPASADIPGQSLAFRLAAALVVALAVEALAPLSPLPLGPQETRLGLWLVGMGSVAALSGGSAIVSGTGYITALSAASLAVPDVVTDPVMHPLTFAVIASLIIVAALGFSFAGGKRIRSTATAEATRATAHSDYPSPGA